MAHGRKSLRVAETERPIAGGGRRGVDCQEIQPVSETGSVAGGRMKIKDHIVDGRSQTLIGDCGSDEGVVIIGAMDHLHSPRPDLKSPAKLP